jgi:HK97 family phage major capsid protein
MDPVTKAFCKKTTKLENAQNSIWEKDVVNEYPAFSSRFVNTDKIYFGEFSNSAIIQNGDIVLIWDELTKAKEGQIVITAIGMFDCGVSNPRAFVIIDASTR